MDVLLTKFFTLSMQKLAMEDQGSLFVQQLENGQSLCLSANASDTIEIIKGFIQDRTGIPATNQVLYPPRGSGKPLLGGNETLSELGAWRGATFQLSCRLRGGKGGFGSLLRGSAKASTTDNEDACRDLSGRRLRVVNAEKKLQEWQAGEKARLAQIRAAKEEKERNRAEKRAEITQEHLDEIRRKESAATESLAKAIRSAQAAGQKRGAEDAPEKPLKNKRFKLLESEDEESSDSDEDNADVPVKALLPQSTVLGGASIQEAASASFGKSIPVDAALQQDRTILHEAARPKEQTVT